MEMIRQVKPDEGEMIRAFAQTVFAAEGGPADFAQLLPKVYRSPQDSARQHLLLEEEGKIQGLLLRTVTQLSAGGRMLPVGHIGSVWSTICAGTDARSSCSVASASGTNMQGLSPRV